MIRLIPQPEHISETGKTTKLRNISFSVIDSAVAGDEAYVLTISENEISARASTEKGLYYAKATFKQILSFYKEEIPCIVIKDSPRYSYRGFMIDCARHMFSVAELKKMIDTAASVKFNVFHWHLSDDQGFRIALSKFPEITKLGSVRDCDAFRKYCRCCEPYSGYYSREDISEILNFCRERYIEIIPEIDMPGHISAVLCAHPEFTCYGESVKVKTSNGIYSDVLCVGNEKTADFIKGLLSEICDIFPGRFVHIGGDETPKKNWKSCSKCQAKIRELELAGENELQLWFLNEITNFLEEKNRTAIIWNDCLKSENFNKKAYIEFWLKKNTGRLAAVANGGQKIIFAPFTPYYCDYPYGMHPLKAVYKHEPEKLHGLNENGKKSIVGVETPVWTEFINSDDRLEFLCFPRWFAVAETGWTSRRNKDYKQFEKACIRLCNLIRSRRVYTAPDDEWNKPAIARIIETIKFFT